MEGLAQVVGQVEALKIPTDVFSPIAGTISRVLVENQQGVEYEQVLFEIEAESESAPTP